MLDLSPPADSEIEATQAELTKGDVIPVDGFLAWWAKVLSQPQVKSKIVKIPRTYFLRI